MEHPNIFWSVVSWLIIWSAIGGIVTQRVFLRKNLDVSSAGLAGATVGAATGPLGLLPLWYFGARIRTSWYILLSFLIAAILVWAFALADPGNTCVTNRTFMASLIVNGLIMGVIYGFMALGLSLIFSILGVVSFAHGEFYMIGGMVVYFFTTTLFPESHPLWGLAAACIVTFAIGAVFECIFLQPMFEGKVERPIEYGILITFGLAFFLQYLVQAIVGASPVKAQRFFYFPAFGVPSAADPWLIRTTSGSVTLLDAVTIPNPRLVAAAIALLMLVLLMFFLYHTWIGRALRAVSQDRQAAAVVGINPKAMNALAFALGGMLAGLSGGTLVQVFSWVPQVGAIPALRSFVIIVLGGLGSLPGAFIGGLIVGLIEALGTGCVPDPTRATAYIPAYGMIILTLVLLLKPTGFFGRKQ